ncbi:2'-5' RNA ligase family protein [Hyphococcus sp.]|uniref:2'-5' RNA ligase family protein n=1 Tax=Hyphococcus sp. TaxID=2038636 RepID=UPI0035C703F9
MNAKHLNLFFALFPDDEAAQNLEALANRLRDVHKLKGKPFLADHFHLSLQNLGGYDVAIAEAAGRAAMRVRSEPFAVRFSNMESFDTRSDQFPLVLTCDEGCKKLEGLHRDLAVALKHEGLGRFARFAFTPHVTLLYADRPAPAHPVDPIGWQVKEFALVVSHVGETRYDFLGQWPLKGDA